MIEPGPVVLLTTAHKGRPNVMTMSWHMMVEFEPPLIACVVSEANFSFAALRSTGEAVIAIPARRLASQVVKVGNCSGRDTDKWRAAGLYPHPSTVVAVPRVKEAVLAVECRVLATFDLDPQRFLDASVNEFYPKADYHRAFVGEAVAVWATNGFTLR